MSAPTGKAASLIDGLTINSVYALPFNQEEGSTGRAHGGEEEILRPPGPERLAKLQNEFCDVLGQIVDEVSMLSQRNMLAIDQRCREATGRQAPFGGLWTIFLGDFRYAYTTNFNKKITYNPGT